MKSIIKIVSLKKSELFTDFHNFLTDIIADLGTVTSLQSKTFQYNMVSSITPHKSFANIQFQTQGKDCSF